MYAPAACRSAAPAARVCACTASRLAPVILGLSPFRIARSLPSSTRDPPVISSFSALATSEHRSIQVNSAPDSFQIRKISRSPSFELEEHSNSMASSASPSRAYMPSNEQQRHDDVFLTRNSVAVVPPSPTKRPRTESSADLERQSHINFSSNAGAISVNHNAKSMAARHFDKALRSVVKIFSTSANPNFNLPWQIMSQSKSTASGFVVAPLSARRILTNAHAVANQVQVMLRKHGNARKYPARVLAVGHECDIAMLTVDDVEFWVGDGGVEALEVGGLPPMQESVTVVGFPQGGDNVCVTKGVASRLDRQQYSHGRCALLTVQTDAPINSGNSGGPVLQGDQVVGLAFQSLIGAENTGYVIPTPVVHHFLNDLERHNGKYTGFPEMGFSWQCLESDDMKCALGMPKGATGIYITNTEPMYDASKVLRAGDVLTSVDGHRIADDGTYMFPDMSVRIDFRHLSSMAYNGDSMKIGIWRDGAALELDLRVHVPQPLVPIHSHDQKPKYYIFAGLVFTRLTNIYLRHHFGVDWATRAPIKLCDRSFCGSMEVPGQEVVLLSKVLSANVNQGFQEMQHYQVYKVNGVKVHNLAHLARMVEQCESEYIRFDLDWKKVIVLHTARGREATPDILSMNCIPATASKGLLEEDPQLPADLTLLSQPSMADIEVVGDEEAVAVEDRIARLASLVNQPGSGDRNSTWSEVSRANENFRA